MDPLLLILCCFGGSPFIDYSKSPEGNKPREPIEHQWDPTDWVATDLSGALLLNASSDPRLRQLVPADLPPALRSLDQCDLWNLTFASGADQRVFHRHRAHLKCRCPPGFAGSACQHSPTSSPSLSPSPPHPLPTSSSSSSSSASSPSSSSPLAMALGLLATSAPSSPSPSSALDNSSFGLYLLIFMLLGLAMVSLFAMLRGCCFCDCFGGFRRPCSPDPPNSRRPHRRDYDKPLDPNTVHRCLEAVREHEQKEMNNGRWRQQQQSPLAPSSGLWVDSRRPLIPSVSECVQQRQQPPPSAPPPPRACSPPPSYRSLNNSLERLPGPANTKI